MSKKHIEALEQRLREIDKSIEDAKDSIAKKRRQKTLINKLIALEYNGQVNITYEN